MQIENRLGIELFLTDVATSMVHDWLRASTSDNLNPESVESGLVDYFMDKIDGPAAPLKEFEDFIKQLAAQKT